MYRYSLVWFGDIILCNTVSVVIKPKNGFGGLGGSIIKQTALANVHKFYTLLSNNKLFDIIFFTFILASKIIPNIPNEPMYW